MTKPKVQPTEKVTAASKRPTPEQLADWRYQCEERIRWWREGRDGPRWRLSVHETLALLDDHALLAEEAARLRRVLCDAMNKVYADAFSERHTSGGFCDEDICFICDIEQAIAHYTKD